MTNIYDMVSHCLIVQKNYIYHPDFLGDVTLEAKDNENPPLFLQGVSALLWFDL